MPPDATRIATVYTSAPKRLREAVFVDLCTLLRPHGRSHDRVDHESHDIDGPMAPAMLVVSQALIYLLKVMGYPVVATARRDIP